MLSDFPILKKKFEMFFSHESKAQNQQNSDEKSYDEPNEREHYDFGEKL